MSTNARGAGVAAPIAACDDVAWGTHECRFYETRRDLLDITIPYLQAGLRRNQRCVWIVSGPLSVDDATAALRREMMDADRHLAAGDLEVVAHADWYLKDGAFDIQRSLERGRAAVADALQRGYDGLRVSANEAWVTDQVRADFLTYERGLSAALAGERFAALCTYPVAGSTAAQVFDAVRAHHSTIARRNGVWEVIEVVELAAARGEIQRQNQELEARVAEHTRELAAAIEELQHQMEERERAERVLRESEELYRLLAEHTNDIIILHDADGRRGVYVSPSFERLLGRAPDDTFGHVHPDDVAAGREAWRRMLAGEETYVTVRHQHADGSWRWLETWGTRVQYRGAPHVMAVSRNVTDRVRAREEIRASEARFRALVEHNDALITIVDEKARALYVSPSYAWILGYTPEDLYLMSDIWSLVHPDDLAWVREQFAQVMQQPVLTLPRPLRAVTKDGRIRNVALTLTDRRHDPAVGGVIGNGRDVTDELVLDEQLRQAQKMEAVGQLAGGAAHDFNNLLTVITAYGATLRAELPADTAWQADLDEILTAANRAAALTRQLLAFSRRQVLQPRVVDVNRTVTTTAGMLRRVIGEDITLQTELAPHPWAVHADPGQLELVVMNLAMNARDAMPHGGTIRLRTANVVVDADAARARPGFVPGEYAALTVEDKGIGIAPEILPHLFEPFFTTKGPGKGTGLGLATVYGIVKQSGGYVYVDSTPGQGSRFTVYLPRHVSAPETEALRRAAAPPRGTETILLVEDESAVRTATRRMLERLGYTVREAVDGTDALRSVEQAAARGERIDLVLTDIVMPHQSGRVLGERLAEHWPGLRILYMSGYTDDEMIRRGLLVPGANFLEKPFTPERLAERVRRALDQAPRA